MLNMCMHMHMHMCTLDTHSPVFLCVALHSLYSQPLVFMRCSEYTAQFRLRVPRLAYSARRLVRCTVAATPPTGPNSHWIRYSGGMVHVGAVAAFNAVESCTARWASRAQGGQQVEAAQ